MIIYYDLQQFYHVACPLAPAKTQRAVYHPKLVNTFWYVVVLIYLLSCESNIYDKAMLRTLSLGLSLLLFLACHNPAAVEPAALDTEKAAELTTVFLVRHAEKESGSDPALTTEGQERAAALAKLLQDVQLDAIYSTSYRRTLETAAPVAELQGLPVKNYAAGELETFAGELLRNHEGETVLVVGHSNTTPILAGLLDETHAYAPFAEDEYDNILMLTINRETHRMMKLTY